MKKLYLFLVVAFAMFPGSSFAAITLPTTINMADWEAMVGLIIVALVALFAYRKIVKSTNRS